MGGALVDMFIIMHTGRIWHATWFWNVLLVAALVLAAIASLITEHMARFRSPAT